MVNCVVRNWQGEEVGETTLELRVAKEENASHIVHRALTRQMNNARQGNASTKTRSEVRGGGRKPWRQKGRGTARAGTTRSPIWVGGGTIHGPRSHDHKLKMTKKSAQQARKSALSIKAKNGEIMVLEDLRFEKPKTKDFNSILKNLKLDDKKVLLLTSGNNVNLYKSGRNLPGVNVLEAAVAATYDLVNNQMIVIQKSAIESLCKPLEN